MSKDRLVWTTRRQAVQLFLRGTTLKVGTPVALFVGTVLSVVNQGSVLLDGNATSATWMRIAVNYLTPFLVASVGFLSGCRATKHDDAA